MNQKSHVWFTNLSTGGANMAGTKAAAQVAAREEHAPIIPAEGEMVVSFLQQYKKPNGEWDTDRLVNVIEKNSSKEDFARFETSLSETLLKRMQPLGVFEMTMAPWHNGGLKGKVVTGCTWLGGSVVVGFIFELGGYALDIPGARPSTYLARFF
jgi:hypothetical protein